MNDLEWDNVGGGEVREVGRLEREVLQRYGSGDGWSGERDEGDDG